MLRERAVCSAEYFVAGFVLRNVLADGFDGSGKINAQTYVFWFAQSTDHRADEVWRALNEVPVVRINRNCANLYQDLVVIGNRFLNVLIFEIRQTVVAVDDRLHGILWCRGLAIALIV